MCSTSKERQLQHTKVGALPNLQPGPLFPVLDERKRYCEGTFSHRKFGKGHTDGDCNADARGLLWVALYTGHQETEGPLAQSSVSHVSLETNHLRRIVALNFVCF